MPFFLASKSSAHVVDLNIDSLPDQSLAWLHKNLTQGLSSVFALKPVPVSPVTWLLTPDFISSPTFLPVGLG